MRLTRELRERGYTGACTAVKRFVAATRPPEAKPYEVRFETPAGQQAQVDFARFVVTFIDAPGASCIVWLFSLVLGHSRHIEARFVLHQDLQTLMRCHMQAFAALGGVPIEILFDRMKTAVTGEEADGHIVYNRSLLALAKHYGFLPRACRPYRAKTKGKVERPFSYIRQDFFVARSFRDLDDLNLQLRTWLNTIANVRLHGTSQRVVSEAFAAEKPELQPLPAHRPRVECLVDVASPACPCCAGALHRIGDDVSERLDVVPAKVRVLVIRPRATPAAPAGTRSCRPRHRRG